MLRSSFVLKVALSLLAALSVFPSCTTQVHARVDLDAFGGVSPWLAKVGRVHVEPYRGSFFESAGVAVLDSPALSSDFHRELEGVLVRALDESGSVVGSTGADDLDVKIERCSMTWTASGFGIQSHALIQLAVSKGVGADRLTIRVHGEDKSGGEVVRFASSSEPQLARAIHQCISRLFSGQPVAAGSRDPVRDRRPVTSDAGQASSKPKSGTGFFVTPHGHLLTNYHVVEGATQLSVKMFDGRVLMARIVKSDAANDVALLKVEADSQPVRFAATQMPRKGEEVFTLGYPQVKIQGNEMKATFGRVNAESGLQNDARFLQVDVPLQPGNSGGPLIDKRGDVVGITTGSLDDLQLLRRSGSVPQNVNYALKAAYAAPLLLSLEGVLPYEEGRPVDSFAVLIEKLEPSIVFITAQ